MLYCSENNDKEKGSYTSNAHIIFPNIFSPHLVEPVAPWICSAESLLCAAWIWCFKPRLMLMLWLPPSSPADEPFLEWPHPCFPNKPSLKRIGFSTEVRRLTYPSFCKLHWGCLIFSHKTWTPESPKAFSPMYSLVREQWELRTNARSSQHADVRQQLTNLACRGDRVSAISQYHVLETAPPAAPSLCWNLHLSFTDLSPIPSLFGETTATKPIPALEHLSCSLHWFLLK